MEDRVEVESLRTLHDALFAVLDERQEIVRSQPDMRDTILQLFMVDSEVVRNLYELLTGENPDPEMLSRDFPEQWFESGRQRIAHWEWPEILTRTRQIAKYLLSLLSKPLPPGLTHDDHRIRELTMLSITATKNALTCVGLSGKGDQNNPDLTP